jgi:hypothetical protein
LLFNYKGITGSVPNGASLIVFHTIISDAAENQKATFHLKCARSENSQPTVFISQNTLEQYIKLE